MRTIKQLITVFFLSASILVQGQTASTKDKVQSAQDIIKKWPQKPREAAEKIIKKYGNPNEATESMLVWHDNGPWKHTIVTKEDIKHNFPKTHMDYVEQAIDYKAPADMYDEIAMYDGSVIIERTKGEISARCDNEAMNFLAINLANEIATGKKDVSAARDFYAKTAMEFMDGKSSPYVEKLMFDVQGNTADPDEEMKMKAMSGSN